jgi:ribosomal protein L24E
MWVSYFCESLCMSLLWLQRNPLPLDWMEQRKVAAQFDA